MGRWRPEVIRTRKIYETRLGTKLQYWMDSAIFLAMACVLILPTGAASGLILLICSVVCLVHGRFVLESWTLSKREFWFLGAMASYPIAVAFNVFAYVEPIAWRYFDDPSRFLLAIPIYLAIRRSRVTTAAFVKGTIVGAAAAGLFSGYQYMVLGELRPGGFVNPISFSGIALLLICMSLAPVPLPRLWCWLRACSVGLGAGAVVLASSRGTFLAVPILTWMMGTWFFSGRPHLKKWSILAPLAIVGGLLLIPHSQHHIVTSTLKEIASLHEPNTGITSMSERLERLRAAWILFTNDPWFGTGFGQYMIGLGRLNDEGLVGGTTAPGTHAHNNYLHLAAEMGVAGLSVYLLQLFCIYTTGRYCCRRGFANVGVMLKIFAVGQSIYSLTDTQFSINITCTFFVMTSTVLVALAFNEIENKRLEPCASACGLSSAHGTA